MKDIVFNWLEDIEKEHNKMEQLSIPEKRLFENDVFVKDTDIADILGPPQEYLFYQNKV